MIDNNIKDIDTPKFFRCAMYDVVEYRRRCRRVFSIA